MPANPQHNKNKYDTDTTKKERIDPKVIKTAIVLNVGALAVVFDTSIISVALRTLSIKLHAPISTIQWVSTGYLLALGISIPLVGWAQARFGAKRAWMFALTIFLIGSILCSLAWNADSLIVFRIIEGLGGGLMLPLFYTMIMQAAKGRSLGRTMSIVTLPMLVGPILGPTIGGLILQGLSWRWLFWVNVPFSIVGFILAWRYLDRDQTNARPKVDFIGWLLLSPSLIALLLGLSNSAQVGGFSRTNVLVPLIIGAVLLVAFVLYSVHRADKALIDVRLFSRKPLSSASAVTFLAGAALFGGMILLPLYWQEVRGADALRAGLLIAPLGIGALISRSIAGNLTDKIGARWVAFTGFVIIVIGTVPFAFASSTTNEWFLMAVLVVRGFGLAAVMIPLSAAAFEGLNNDEIPHAGIITRVAQQIGGSFGVAILAVVLDSALRNVSNHGNSAKAFDQASLWAVGLTVVGLMLSLLLPGRIQENQDENDI